MNTIVRNNGKVDLFNTVKKTLLIIAKSGGMYSIGDIQRAINNQLPDAKEQLSYGAVRRTIVDILASAKRKGIDKSDKA